MIEHGRERALRPPPHLVPACGAKLTDELAAEPRKWRADPRWHPHQLRHAAAARFRREYGAEATQVLLGHQNLRATELYAGKDVAAAVKVMKAIG